MGNFETLMRLPLNQIFGAYKYFSGYDPAPSGMTKVTAAQWLAQKMDDSIISMSAILAAPAYKKSAADAPAVGSPEMPEVKSVSEGDVGALLQTLDKKAGAVAESVSLAMKRVEHTEQGLREVHNMARQATEQAQRMTAGLNVIQRNMMDTNQLVKEQSERVTKTLESFSERVEKIVVSEAQVQAAVGLVVAKAFEPFKRIVEDANAQEQVAEFSSVHVVETKPVLDVFGIDLKDAKGNQLMVSMWNHPHAPAIDPNFIWSEKILRHLLLSQETGENLWFGGEKGTGKSETARQFAARTGRGYCRINFHKYTTTADYLGDKGLLNGNTYFEEGDFLLAWKTPSTIILLDEITNCSPGELAPLNGLLEPDSAVSIGGAVRRRAPGVLVFAADNTLTNGDETGRYAGTQQMNSALADRFSRLIHFTHMDRTKEVKAVMNHTGCTKELAEHIVDAVIMSRKKVESGDVIDAPSIRQIVAFIKALKVMNVDDAWTSTISNRQPSESSATLQSIRHACINEKLIKNNL